MTGQLFEAVESHMGALVKIKLVAADCDEADAALREAFARIAGLDAILSDYNPASELNRICRDAVKSRVAVSSDLFQVLQAAQGRALESDGAFDVTAGPLNRVWREARRHRELPDAQSVDRARDLCGYRKLELDPVERTLKLDMPGMQLDAGGIGKGYAADEAIATLSRRGVRSALVNFSGELRFTGNPPGRAGWSIGLKWRNGAGAAETRTLCLSYGAVSTSGAEEQYVCIGGVRYSHIIDPRTGWALREPITVTVMAPDGIRADSLSTAVSVLGREVGPPFVERSDDVAAVISAETTTRAHFGRSFRQESLLLQR
jgi:thiamine biosynthesis lipoprotein